MKKMQYVLVCDECECANEACLRVHACVCVFPRPPPFRSEASVMVLQRSGFFRGWYLAAGHV